MLLKSSLANQEAVQAKAAGEKKKEPSEWARGRKNPCSVCVCERVCVVFIPPLSRSLSICVLQSWAAFEWGCGCVYEAQFAAAQSEGVSKGLCYTLISNWK